jgi:DNA-binding transcriptional LysR family regulator
LPTVEQVRAFCAVADSRSYSAAGRALGKHRVAINRLVARFTDVVGQGILVHASTAGHATLTPQGDEVLGAARRFLAAADALLQQRPAVRFSAYPSIAQRVVAGAPELLSDEFPVEFVEVAERVRHDGGRRLVADVAAGHLDLAVAPAGQAVLGVAEEVSYSWALRVVFPGQAFGPVRLRVRPAELIPYRLLATPVGHRSRDLLASAFEADGLPLDLAVESESQELLRDIALHSYRHAAVLPDDAFGAPNARMGPQLVTSASAVYGGTYSIYSRSDEAAGGEASADPRGQLVAEVARRVRAALTPPPSE